VLDPHDLSYIFFVLVLQCVAVFVVCAAVCCGVLQCVDLTHAFNLWKNPRMPYLCSVLQRVALYCSVLQQQRPTGLSTCVAVCCNVLQCVAMCCSVMQCFTVWCSVVQCVAVCCRVLPCVAACCSVLQRRRHTG